MIAKGSVMTPILLLGAGRMGGALVQGWREAGAFAAADLIVRDPNIDAAAFQGAAVNPPLEALSAAKTVLLAVKPQIWREAVRDIVPHLAPDAVIVSIAAGVRAADIAEAVCFLASDRAGFISGQKLDVDGGYGA